MNHQLTFTLSPVRPAGPGYYSLKRHAHRTHHVVTGDKRVLVVSTVYIWEGGRREHEVKLFYPATKRLVKVSPAFAANMLRAKKRKIRRLLAAQS